MKFLQETKQYVTEPDLTNMSWRGAIFNTKLKTER